MNKKIKIIVGLCIVVLFTGIVLILLGVMLVKRSFTPVDGVEYVQSLSGSVKIYRDNYGVPHIEAQTEEDAFFAVGYVHAQDRLWQMELHRRAGLGKLSEIIGIDALPFDKMYRTLGFKQLSERMYFALDEKTRSALQAYCNGINEFIQIHKGAYPIEFDILQFEPEPWTVENTLLISRLMAWELNYARWVDMTCAAIVDRVGEQMAIEAFPYWQPDAPLIITDIKKSKSVVSVIERFTKAEELYYSSVGTIAMVSGSNAWVVGGNKSITGKPILSNDPHLLLMFPARWYEVHLKAPTIDVAGMTIPGVPFVVVGRNTAIAWGVTNAMLDDADFYIEEVDSIPSPKMYRGTTEWKKIDIKEDTIYVRNDKSVVFNIYSTERGPIINAVEPGAELMGNLVSVRWTGFETSDEVGAFYKINKSTNWNEFLTALKTFGVPAQNFIYADTNGTIGYVMAGKIPIRNYNGVTLPLEGWNLNHAWKGFVPFEQNPKMLNPEEGFIITANNKIVSDEYPYYLSSHWEPPWRARRLWSLISRESLLSPEQMERIQSDVHSLQSEDIIPYILADFDTIEVTRPELRRALEYFKNWHFKANSEDVATTLFESTIRNILINTFADEMGDTLFTLYCRLASTPLTALIRVLGNAQSVWFDNIHTPEIETRDAIIRKSLEQAIDELKQQLGGEMKEWQWGRLHTVTFDHVFALHPMLKQIFKVGPFSMSGTHSTINVGYYFLTEPYACKVGASMRQIMNLADINDTRVVLPPGQSGQLFHKHYSDQVTLWLNNSYRQRVMDFKEVEQQKNSLLLLEVHQ